MRRFDLRNLSRLSLIALTTACVRPSAIVRYAESASKTAEEFPALAREMYSSCLRFESYKSQRSSMWTDDASVRRACASRDTAVAAVIMTNRVLIAYLDVLAAMGGGRSPEKEVGPFVKLLVTKAGFDEAQVNASERLASFVSSTVVSGLRRGELTRVIVAHNADLQNVTAALLKVLTNDFRAAFDVESRAMDNFYRTSLTEYGNKEPLAAILVREQRDKRLSDLETRRRAVQAYATALQRIQSGHQKLYDERAHLDAPALARDLIKMARELDSIAGDLERSLR